MKVKSSDAQRALAILKADFIKTTGLSEDDLSVAEAIFSVEAETVVCPACSTRFKPELRRCPECSLEFG